MTYPIDDFFTSYANGNLSWCRDEFWGSSKQEMRDIMLEAYDRLALADPTDMDNMGQFIRVIFLP